MADGHLLYGADGHLLYGASGHLVNDCGTPSGYPCTECANPPSQLAVVVSGVTACDGCIPRTSGSAMWHTAAINVNGTYVLDQLDSTTCEWEKRISVSGYQIRSYSLSGDHTCSGTYKIANVYQVWVYADTLGFYIRLFTNTDGHLGSEHSFTANFSIASSNCDDSWGTFDNSETCDESAVHHSGSATIVPA
jgi:hypothetical protein